jgi:hypothetical protein
VRQVAAEDPHAADANSTANCWTVTLRRSLAATTKRAILAICELGDGDNALALARVLLENACLLEWLIRGDGRRRLEAYVMFTSVVHERVVQTIQRHRGRMIVDGGGSDRSSDPYHRAVWTHVFRDQKGHPKRRSTNLGLRSRHWSGHTDFGQESLPIHHRGRADGCSCGAGCEIPTPLVLPEKAVRHPTRLAV